MRLLKYLSLYIMAFGFLNAQVQKGKIAGQIIDARSLQPLAGVNVIISGTQLGASTDQDGVFLISDLQPANYNLQIVYVGYITLKKNNVVVNPGRKTVVEYKMTENILEGESIEVAGSYFEKPKEAVVSSRSMNFEEIRRSPGDIQDIQRAVQSLPAVVSSADQMNEIIIRGGIPGENLFIMDGIEIANPNHFPVPGAGGGPINLLNSYLVRDLDFYAGAFSAKYGDKASSVMEITNRDGSRESLRGEVNMGMAGVGGLLEGPISGNASYIFSARKSFLDLIISSTGLTAVPQYYNLQGKITWDLNPNNRLWINGVFGDDGINIEEGDEGGYGRGAENVVNENQQYILGATLRTFWAKNLYSNSTVAGVKSSVYTDVYELNEISEKDTWFTDQSSQSEFQFKSDFNWQLSKDIEFSFGGSYKAVQNDFDIWADADTIFHFASENIDAPKDSIVQIYDEYRASQEHNSYKTSAYSQFSYDFLNRFRITAGLRYDYFKLTQFSSISPRSGFSWFATPKLTISLAYGKHYQFPSYIEINANPLNKNLSSKYTDQYVLGFDYLIKDDTRITIEGYYKTYNDVPIQRESTTLDPLDDFDGERVNKGEGQSNGFELFFQKKLTRSFSSIVSYSFSKSTAIDPRTGREYNWDYDYRNVFTLVTGYKFFWREQAWFQDFKKSFIYNFISWFPFTPADEDELSIKWRYLGGRPYTARTYLTDNRVWIIDPIKDLNTRRFPVYHRLDFRIDKRFIFDSYNLVVFFDLINVYGRDNLWNYNYGTLIDANNNVVKNKEKVLQFKVFPVGGFSLEF